MKCISVKATSSKFMFIFISDLHIIQIRIEYVHHLEYIHFFICNIIALTSICMTHTQFDLLCGYLFHGLLEKALL